MIDAISHLTFIVKDLNRGKEFFEKIFGAKEVYSSGDKTFSLSREKFFLIGEVWVCIMEGTPPAERGYTHTAFKISEADFDAAAKNVYMLGVDILPERTRIPGEGRSLYFYDFDNHLFELHTGDLQTRLSCYGKSAR